MTVLDVIRKHEHALYASAAMEAFWAMLGNLETIWVSAGVATAMGSTAMGLGAMSKGSVDASLWRFRSFSPLAMVSVAEGWMTVVSES